MRYVIAALILFAYPPLTDAAGQQPGGLNGVVRDSMGLPVEGVDVVLSGPSGMATATTSRDGVYRFDIAVPGGYQMSAAKSGFRPWTRAVVLESGTPVVIDVDLEPSYAETLIVTASRTPESLITTPASVSVLDSRRIEVSATDNYADLLRSVPGLNITQFGARDININTRSSTGILANSMLVMVDGRSFFQPLYGAVYWDLMTMSTEEIGQIEVVRSPASAVWGANALSGVINIRTKSPRQMEGLQGHLGAGERGTRTAGVVWADSNDRFSYKVSGSYFEQEPWQRDNVLPNGEPMPPTAIFENRGTKQPKFDVRVDWDGDRSRVWSLRGGVAGAYGFIHSALGPAEFGSGSYASYLEVDHRSDNLDFKLYWNRLDAPFRIVLFGLDEDAINDTYVSDVARRLKVGDRHNLTLGGSVRFDRFDITIAPRDRGRLDAGAFIEDHVSVSQQLSVVVGGRLDKFDTTGAVFAPRLGVVVSPIAGHSFRMTYNRAYRAPSLLENFVDVALPSVVPLSPPFFYSLFSLGSTDLEMEKQDAVELGYTGVLNSKTTISATVYDQRITNNILFLPVSFYGPGAPPPGWPLDPNLVPPLPSVFSFLNLGQVRDRGVELATNVEWPRASLHGSYTFQQDPRLRSGTNIPLEINRPAKHQTSGGFTYFTNRWSASGDIHYTDRAFWADVLTEPFWGYTDAFVSVNARVAYRPRGSAWELWLSAANLLDEKIKSHVFGDTVRRKITAGLHWRLD
jgi:outer membrane receptor protein involved in Fe transport